MKSVIRQVVTISIIIIASAIPLAGHAGEVINGAGASFPAPVYRPWTYHYSKSTGSKINYQSVGSGAGIRQIKGKTVDFGASDKPLKKSELDSFGLIQFPMLMGGVVIVANIPGIKNNQLKLSSEVVADIFLGKIKKWNDSAITNLNAGLKLPNLPITVVHRSDGSGTTWIFTNYLTKISESWKNGAGNGKSVKWPCGIGGQKNPGVAVNVMKIKGAIGYVEYTYATEAKLNTVLLKNRDGNFVAPNMQTFQAAGANAKWKEAPGFYMVLTNQAGKDSWPITGVTYILVYKKQTNKKKITTMLDYFSWCYNEGCKTAKSLNYVPIPDNVVKLVKTEWQKSIRINGTPAFQTK